MENWILKLLVLPAFMLFAGMIWYRCPPEQDSKLGLKLKGYTEQPQVWIYAQHTFARLMMVFGIVMAVFTWLWVLLDPSEGEEARRSAFTVYAIQLLALYLPVFITKSLIRKRYHDFGKTNDKSTE